MPADFEATNQPPNAPWPQLSRAPIVEGLIDIRVRPTDPISMERLTTACAPLAESFPGRTEMRQWRGQISAGEELSPTIATQVEGPTGLMLRSADERWIVRFDADGMSVSRLEPYTGWQELKAMTRELWEIYQDAVADPVPTRLACRYINKIPLGMDEQLEDTFRTHFVLPPDLPQSFIASLLRVALHFKEDDAVAFVTQSIDPGQQPDEAVCIFDIDAFDANPAGFDLDHMWTRLEALRDIKNRAFFRSLTKQAVERFG